MMAEAAEKTILHAQNITNRFGKQLIHDDISFTINQGEIIGIVGESGSGKSVMLKTMTGLRTPTTGTITLKGKKLHAIKPSKRASMFGVLFQEGALFSGLTVTQNIMLPLSEHTKLSQADCRQLAAFKLALVGLEPEVGEKYPSQLSGGMTKRVSLARALALDPPILFLDEPTAGLDPVSATAFDQMIVMLNKTLGVTIIMVTHDLDTLFSICTRVAVLVDHKLIIESLDVLLENQHPWIQEYLHGPRAYGAKIAARKAVIDGE
ncbi:MAG: ATP-binding cassette domain-containing protein [Pseudomonadota bacterium]